jgi:hypothetical protein
MRSLGWTKSLVIFGESWCTIVQNALEATTMSKGEPRLTITIEPKIYEGLLDVTDRRHPRLGHVECFNLDLLTKLTKRPRTIVNPPRMRNDTETETITNWYKEPGRMRRDALAYAAPEIRDDLRARMRLPVVGETPELSGELTDCYGDGTASDWPAEGEIPLAAAE